MLLWLSLFQRSLLILIYQTTLWFEICYLPIYPNWVYLTCSKSLPLRFEIYAMEKEVIYWFYTVRPTAKKMNRISKAQFKTIPFQMTKTKAKTCKLSHSWLFIYSESYFQIRFDFTILLEGTDIYIFYFFYFFFRFNWSFNRRNMLNAYFILLEFKLGKIRRTTNMRSGYITFRIHKFKINSESYATTTRSSCNNDRKFTTMVTGVSQSLVCSRPAFLQSQQRKPQEQCLKSVQS